jgi:hypothetical protein
MWLQPSSSMKFPLWCWLAHFFLSLPGQMSMAHGKLVSPKPLISAISLKDVMTVGPAFPQSLSLGLWFKKRSVYGSVFLEIPWQKHISPAATSKNGADECGRGLQCLAHREILGSQGTSMILSFTIILVQPSRMKKQHINISVMLTIFKIILEFCMWCFDF